MARSGSGDCHRNCRVLSYVCATSLMLAAGSSARADDSLIEARGQVSLGSFLNNSELKIRVDGESSEGTRVDWDNTFGDDEVTRFRLDGLWRVSDRHHVRVLYTDYSRNRTETIEQDIEWQGDTIPVDALVHGKQSFSILEAAYEYAFVHSDKYELAGSIGFHYTSFEASLRASLLHCNDNGRVKVTVLPSRREFDARGDEPVLSAALRQHLNLPHSCKGGSCGTCRVRVLRGSFAYPYGRPIGIDAAEEEAGYALICQARATEELVIEIREIRNVTDVEIRELPARVERMERLAPDVMGLWLRLPAIEPFNWRSGQYVDVMLPGERRRSFSLANPPHDSALLELHVRRAPGGEFSEKGFGGMKQGSLLRIEGPLGQFFYRPEASRPALLIGGGTGYAPLKAMIREVLESGSRRDLVLYWGARTEADLYEDAWLRELAAKHAHFHYTPVLTEFVHEAVLKNVAGLAGFDVYAAGPPAMIDAVRTALPRHGAEPERIYFDSFDYAPA